MWFISYLFSIKINFWVRWALNICRSLRANGYTEAIGMEDDVENVRLFGNNYIKYFLRVRLEFLIRTFVCTSASCKILLKILRFSFSRFFFFCWINSFKFEHLIDAIPIHAMNRLFSVFSKYNFPLYTQRILFKWHFWCSPMNEHWSWPFDFPSEQNVINHFVCAPSKQWLALTHRFPLYKNAGSPLWIVDHHLQNK